MSLYKQLCDQYQIGLVLLREAFMEDSRSYDGYRTANWTFRVLFSIIPSSSVFTI